MTNRYLSQEEIDAILQRGIQPAAEELSDVEIDALGEIGNISMGTAATTLSQLLNNRVTITTPRVKVMTKEELFEHFEVPYLAILVKFIEGLSGFSLLVVKNSDAKIIADILMGGSGVADDAELSELQVSAACEVMNQMIGTAATSMNSMFSTRVNISPPEVVNFDVPPESTLYPQIGEETLAVVFFRMVVGNLIDSEILQVMPVSSAKEQVAFLMGTSVTPALEEKAAVEVAPIPTPSHIRVPTQDVAQPSPSIPTQPAPIVPTAAPVVVQKAEFSPLPQSSATARSSNIDLILDVSLQVSVVLGKSRKSIKDILSLGAGSVVELDRMVEDQVDVLVNGTLIARGEIVVVNENFGVRLTSVLSPQDRIKEIGKGR